MEEAIGSNDVVNTMDWTGDQRGVVGYSWDTINNERRLGCWGSATPVNWVGKVGIDATPAAGLPVNTDAW